MGHLSAFGIPTEPTLKLYGLGDLVVKPRYRRGGVAGRVIAAALSECERRGAEVVVVDTVAAREQFSALAFAPAAPWSFFYQRAGACHRHRHWLARWYVCPVRPVELLEHGDF